MLAVKPTGIYATPHSTIPYYNIQYHITHNTASYNTTTSTTAPGMAEGAALCESANAGRLISAYASTPPHHTPGLGFAHGQGYVCMYASYTTHNTAAAAQAPSPVQSTMQCWPGGGVGICMRRHEGAIYHLTVATTSTPSHHRTGVTIAASSGAVA